jgi:hypothetical protein
MFPRRLPELPRKQISPEVLASLGYTVRRWFRLSDFTVYKGNRLRVGAAQDIRRRSRRANFNVNASHTEGSDLLFCPVWFGATACHDVP